MWARIVSILLGLWLMAAPAVLGYGGAAAVNDRIVGPIVAALAVVAVSEITRGLRWASVPAGAWLIIAPWLLGYGPTPMVNSLVVGLLLIPLAWVRGRVKARYGGGWASLFKNESKVASE